MPSIHSNCLFFFFFHLFWVSLVTQTVKNLTTMWETWIRSLGQEDSLEKGMATHSSILAWRIPWTAEFMGSQRVGQDWETFSSHPPIMVDPWSWSQALIHHGATKPAAKTSEPTLSRAHAVQLEKAHKWQQRAHEWKQRPSAAKKKKDPPPKL